MTHSQKSGHYTVFIKINDEWLYFNDENVYKVTPDLVKKLAFESNTKCASMVFYIKHEAIYEIGKYISKVYQHNPSVKKSLYLYIYTSMTCYILKGKENEIGQLDVEI